MAPTAPSCDISPRPADSFRRWGIFGAILIVAAAAAVYASSFDGVFVLDDNHAIVRNMQIRRLWPIGPVLRSARPVLFLSLALNYRMGGLDPWGYHATNLAVHAAAALALYGVGRRTLRRPRIRRRLGGAAMPAALAIALIWTVHPLHTGSVTYVIQRAESMMGMFYLLTLYCAARGVSARRPKAWFALAVLCCGLGMGVKEVAVTAPLMVLAWDRIFTGRPFRKILRRRWGLYAALAGTWGVVLVRLTARGAPKSAGFATSDWTPVSYALTQLGVIVRYLALSLLPAGQCLDPAVEPARTFARIALPGAVVAALLAATVWALWRRPAWGFAGLWFFLILAPTSSVMPIADAMFEHRMYLSLAAVVSVVVAGSVLIAGRLARATVSRPALQAIGWAGVVAAAAALGVLSTRRNGLYHDDLAMYRDVVTKAPGNARAHRNLGVALDRRGRTAEAMAHFREAVRILPDCPYSRNN
ncbi:MAG: tetratricopeptide repeat protein, partial [Planctomycetota bacterium]